MLKSWRLGRLFGFPVEINLSFLLLLAVVFIAYGGLAGVVIVALAFGSVLLHELGHALVARRLGVPVSGIELSFFGGAAKMMQMPRTANHEIAIAAAGPAVSLMLAGAGLGLRLALDAPLVAMIGWINLVLAGFNLIPALPMDGGRILRALLTRRMSFVRATDVAVSVSRVFAVGFGVLGLLGALGVPSIGSYQLLLLAPLLWILGTQERMAARAMISSYADHDANSRDPFDRSGFDRFSQFDRLGRFSQFDRLGRFGEPGVGGPAVRRFTVRQVGGRMTIIPLD